MDPTLDEAAIERAISAFIERSPVRFEITSEPWLEPEDGFSGSERSPGSHCRICVRDSGCGMDSEILQEIFEPFLTTRARKRGAGLGLSTVRGVDRRHGGSIEVESAPGQGTAFRLSFPLAVVRSPERRAELGEEPLGGGVESIGLLEDDAAIRRMVASMLESVGYSVRSFERGEEAVASPPGLGQDHGPDLLIPDLVLPGIDGARRLRGLPDKALHAPRRAVLGKVREALGRGSPGAPGRTAPPA